MQSNSPAATDCTETASSGRPRASRPPAEDEATLVPSLPLSHAVKSSVVELPHSHCYDVSRGSRLDNNVFVWVTRWFRNTDLLDDVKRQGRP